MVQIENTPYWKTLLPIIESGAMQAAIDGVYKYPYRINLYPGTSCMFSCLFCGRNYDAVVKGKHPNIFKQVIEQDDKKDPYRINVSGGLEPLTSPYIGEICKDLFDNVLFIGLPSSVAGSSFSRDFKFKSLLSNHFMFLLLGELDLGRIFVLGVDLHDVGDVVFLEILEMFVSLTFELSFWRNLFWRY